MSDDIRVPVTTLVLGLRRHLESVIKSQEDAAALIGLCDLLDKKIGAQTVYVERILDVGRTMLKIVDFDILELLRLPSEQDAFDAGLACIHKYIGLKKNVCIPLS